jgi:hypothetical protein
MSVAGVPSKQSSVQLNRSRSRVNRHRPAHVILARDGEVPVFPSGIAAGLQIRLLQPPEVTSSSPPMSRLMMRSFLWLTRRRATLGSLLRLMIRSAHSMMSCTLARCGNPVQLVTRDLHQAGIVFRRNSWVRAIPAPNTRPLHNQPGTAVDGSRYVQLI